jgi:hypothetical protein
LVLVIVTFGIWALIDVAQTPVSRVRRFPKSTWSVLVLIPVLGAAGWFLDGRSPVPRGAGGTRAGGPAPRPIAPDDDPEFLRRLGGPKRPEGSP